MVGENDEDDGEGNGGEEPVDDLGGKEEPEPAQRSSEKGVRFATYVDAFDVDALLLGVRKEAGRVAAER